MKTAFLAFLVTVSFICGMLLDGFLQTSPPTYQASQERNLEAAAVQPLPNCAPNIRSVFLSALGTPKELQATPQEEGETAKLSLDEAEALFSQALATTSYGKRSELIRKVAQEIDVDSIPKVIGWQGRIPGFVDRDVFGPMLLVRWSEHDLQGALAYAQGLKSGEPRNQALQTVVNSWLQNDPEAATDWVLRQQHDASTQDLVVEAIERLSQQDPAKAMALTEGLEPGKDGFNAKGILMPTILSQWASLDPGAAAARANQLTDEDQRRMAIQSVVSTWAGQDPDAAMAWVRTLPPGDQRDQAWSTAVVMQSNSDPEGALKRALADPEVERSPEVLSTLASNWAMKDKKSALAWAEGLPSGKPRDHALGAVGSILAADDPREAMRLAQGMSSADLQQGLVRDAVRQWVDSDPQAAASEIANLPGGELRQQAVQMLVDGWSSRDPEAAAAYVRALPPGDEKDHAVSQIVVGMGYNDPQAAAAYLTSYRGTVPPEVVGQVVSGWASQNLDEVTTWVANLPAGAVRDNALASLVDQTFEDNPTAAAAQLSQISDENLRIQSQRQLAVRFLISDDEASQAWIRGGQIPEQLKALFPNLAASPGCSCSCPSAQTSTLETTSAVQLADESSHPGGVL